MPEIGYQYALDANEFTGCADLAALEHGESEENAAQAPVPGHHRHEAFSSRGMDTDAGDYAVLAEGLDYLADGRAEEQERPLRAFEDAEGARGNGAGGYPPGDERDTKALVPTGGDAVATTAGARAEGDGEVWRRVICVVIPVFMGYASLVTMQHRLMNRYATNYGRALTKARE